MFKRIVIALCLCFYCTVSYAQTTLLGRTDFTYSGNLVGSAAWDEATQTIQLAKAMYSLEGTASANKALCMPEGYIEFDAYLDSKLQAEGGGAGLFLVTRPLDNPGKALNLVEFNVWDTGIVGPYNSIHVFKFNANNTFEKPWILSSLSNRSSNSLVAPVRLPNGSWKHVTLLFSKIAVTVIVNDPVAGIYVVANQRIGEQNTAFTFQLFGWTGAGRSNFAVKNVKTTVTVPGVCAGEDPLSVLEVQSIVDPTCGAGCAPGLLDCASSVIDIARESNVVLPDVEKAILDNCAAKTSYCEGLSECQANLETEKTLAFQAGIASVPLKEEKATSYQTGFTAGVGSVPLDSEKAASYQTGFDAGVVSVPLAAEKATSYQTGFDAGVVSVPLESEKATSYQTGFTAGVVSVPLDAEKAASYQTGFDAGVVSVPLAAEKATSYQTGFEAGVVSVPLEAEKVLSYQTGYQTGYSAGVESVPVVTCPEPTICPAAPVCPAPTACPVTPPSTGLNAAEVILDKCPCDSAKNHGAYVSCVAHVLNGLEALDLISKADSQDITRTAAQSQCGKPQKSGKKCTDDFKKKTYRSRPHCSGDRD